MSYERKALEMIKSFEGFRSKPYLPTPDDVWTIGYGTTKGITKNTPPINEKQAEAMLLDYVRNSAVKTVDKLVDVPLNENQMAALVSFVYNIGETNFASSTLLKLLNRGDYKMAAEQFKRWNKQKGNVLAGLTRRREAERALFVRPV